MQPISTIRSPPAGDKPVVSVSKTISRMASLNTRREAETSQYIATLGAGLFEGAGSVDDKVGTRPLCLVRQLAVEDLLELPGRHSRTGQHPFALQFRSRGDDDDLVERLVAAGFEQQGDVEQQCR